MVLLRLARKTGDQRRAEEYSRYFLPERSDELPKVGLRRAPVHAFQNTVRSVLDRQVEITADLFLRADRLDELRINLLRVTVENADPVQLLDLTELFEKFMQRFMSVEVKSIECRLLRDQNEFGHTVAGKTLRFCDQLFPGNTSVMSADLRDNAVSAVLVTPFRDLQKSVVTAGRDQSFCLNVRIPAGILQKNTLFSGKCVIDRLRDARPAGRPDDRVYFRDLFKDLLFISLCHAARDHKDFQIPGLLQVSESQDFLYALCLGLLYEAAGIDHRRIRFILVICDLIPVFGKDAEHFLGIDKIFVAAEGNHIQFHKNLHLSFLPGFFRETGNPLSAREITTLHKENGTGFLRSRPVA